MQQLTEALHAEKQSVEGLTNKLNQEALRTREFETKSANQVQQLELQRMELAKTKTELLEKEALILKMRGDTTKMQGELGQMLNTTNEEKEKLRSEYLAVIDRQKKELSALNEHLLQNDRQGQDLDAKSRSLADENERLRQSLAQSEQQLADQTGEMAQQIKTYKIKLNEMLDQLEGKNSEIANTEQMLKSKEEALQTQQADLLKQKDLKTQLDADLI